MGALRQGAARQLLSDKTSLLHRQLSRRIGDGIDLHGVARSSCDVRIGDELDIEQTFRSISGPQEIDLAETAAPAFEPEHQFLLLLVRTLEMNQHIDVACRARGCILGAANQVKRLDPELLGIELRRNPLRHAETPAPVFLAAAIHRLRHPNPVCPSVGREGDR